MAGVGASVRHEIGSVPATWRILDDALYGVVRVEIEPYRSVKTTEERARLTPP